MAVTTMAVIGAAAGIAGPVMTAVKASDDEKEFRNKQKQQEDILADVENSRQAIYNPMQGLSNEAAKVGVATQAAEFQAEEADIALANTLDTMRASGYAQGGATTLAQMALRSKQGISADLQKQELANRKAEAQAAMAIQQAQAEGSMWQWQQQENRDLMELDRAQNLADKFEAQANYNAAQQWAAVGNTASAVTSGMSNISSTLE